MRFCAKCRAAFRSAVAFCPRDGTEVRGDIPDPLLGQVMGERYRIQDLIGDGGVGRIYRAAHTRIAGLIAIKVLYGELAFDPRMRARFQREGEAASALQHRNIMRVSDFGESSEGHLYLVMELIEGVSLASLLTRVGALAWTRAAAITRQIARGLAHAHKRGVIHRDLKPDNIMLVLDDEDPDTVKILDFGLARTSSAKLRLTAAAEVGGTPEYMAPEQFRTMDVDGRADLYALGVVLYQMLTGATPFHARTVPEFAALHFKKAPEPPRDRVPDIPPALEALVLSLLAKKPDDRPPSGIAVVETLNTLERGTPPPKAPPGAPSELFAGVLQRTALVYNEGEHESGVRLLREAAVQLLRDALTGREALVQRARLATSLARADHLTSPNEASWELRNAFDDLKRFRPATHPPGTDAVAIVLRDAETLIAPRFQAGQLDVVGDYYIALCRELITLLPSTNRDPALTATLETGIRAAVQAGGGSQALAVLGSALRALRDRMAPTPVEVRATSRWSSLPASGPEMLAGTARVLSQAIMVGASALHEGDFPGCSRVYVHAAESIVDRLGAAPASQDIVKRLRHGLAEAAALPAQRAVWALRHAFDEILALAQQGSSPS